MSTAFQHGLSSYGIPLVGQNVGLPQGRGGQCWIVDNSIGNDSNEGSIDYPMSTIQATIDKAVAGDTIMVFAGTYEEQVIVNKDYISIIGAQISGYAKPDIIGILGETALQLSAQGGVVRHCRIAAASTQAAMFISGNGFVVEDCVIDGDGGAGIILVPSDTDDSFTASEGVISGCYIRDCTVGIVFDTALPAIGVGSTDNLICGNRFIGNTLDIATADTGGASTYSVQRVNITGNHFQDKNKATYIDLTTANGGAAAAQTGVIDGNWFACDFGVATAPTTTQIKMVGTGFTFTGNYGTLGLANGSGLD